MARLYAIQASSAIRNSSLSSKGGRGREEREKEREEQRNGTPGRVAALTDQNGIPLLASGNNIVEDPVAGESIVTSIDIAMQRQAERILEEGLKQARSDSGSLIIMDPHTGRIKAMANYPSYDPASFSKVEDPLLFTNPAVSSPLEPGSIMKVLTMAAGLDSGAISPTQSYYDPAQYRIDGAPL